MSYAWITALVAGAAAGWGQLQGLFARVSSLIVVTASVDAAASEPDETYRTQDPVPEESMNEPKKGDVYVADPRVLEQYSIFDLKFGTMGGWSYDKEKLREHSELIARYVLEWELGRHWHDQNGNCRRLDEVTAAYEGDRLVDFLIDEIAGWGGLELKICYEDLEKLDPLHKKHGYLYKAVVNGHEGRSVDEFGFATWHALLNWAFSEKEKKEKL